MQRQLVISSVLAAGLLGGCSRTPVATHMTSFQAPQQRSQVLDAMLNLPTTQLPKQPPLPQQPPLNGQPPQPANMPPPPEHLENAIPTDLPGLEHLQQLPNPHTLPGMPNGIANPMNMMPNQLPMPHAPQPLTPGVVPLQGPAIAPITPMQPQVEIPKN